METMNRTVAQTILKFRKETGLSQLKLATEADIALKTLHAAEHAASNLKLGALEKIADALGVPAERLFGEKEESAAETRCADSASDRSPAQIEETCFGSRPVKRKRWFCNMCR